MKAMILAAGRGERMRPLTLNCPKPLLQVGGKPLLEHWLARLDKLPITQIIINVAYLGEQIAQYIQARKNRIDIVISHEQEPLETGGAINKVLQNLGEEPFLLINGDVYCDIELAEFVASADVKSCEALLLLVNNPEHNPNGDFSLLSSGNVTKEDGHEAFTFSGISLMSPALIQQFPARRQKFALREVFDWAIEQHLLFGQCYRGYWLDVGTPERLMQLDKKLTEV